MNFTRQEEENVRYEYRISSGMEIVTVLNPIKINGQVTEIIGSATDITKGKLMEKELQESEKKYRLMAENISDMLIILDSRMITQYASPSHERILGYGGSVVGNYRLSLIHPDDRNRVKLVQNNLKPTNRIIQQSTVYVIVMEIGFMDSRGCRFEMIEDMSIVSF
jgi:PAS domain-containing protein